MSIEAIGLLAYFLSLPHDWVIYKTQVHTQLDIGREKLDRVFKELQSHGYILSVERRIEGTGKIEWEHIVYDKPYNGEPPTAEPSTALPHTANPQLLNTNIQKKQYKRNISSPSQAQEDTAPKFVKDLVVTEKSSDQDKIIKRFHSFFCKHRTKPDQPFKHKVLLGAQVAAWKKDLDLLMRVDKRTKDELFEVYTFIKSSKDPFWRDTILSLGGVRKHFDQIWDKKEAEKEKTKQITPEGPKEGVFQGNIKRVSK